MLLFIVRGCKRYQRRRKFQYISCCCLSVKRLWRQLQQQRFNTSHVVVYHIRNSTRPCFSLCFNTSHVVVYPEIEKLNNQIIKFQYISCCCLSSAEGLYKVTNNGFNTSHVVVYLGNTIKDSVYAQSFNTSHVVVYPRSFPFGIWLLGRFQYISCCCLSLYFSYLFREIL